MESLPGVGLLTNSPFPRLSRLPLPQRPLSKKTPAFFLFKATSRPVSEDVEDDVLQLFFKDRELNGDFISKASDVLWRKGIKVFDADSSEITVDTTQLVEQAMRNDDYNGFLKLSKTQEWSLGESSAPINKKANAKASQDDSERRKKLNFLKYEAIKRELMLLSVGIGTICSGYCLVMFSVQAAISYAVGVLFSCLYLQLLYGHVDNLSRENVPQIFKQKKIKKIGIRSEDLEDLVEKMIKGSGIALSSPRLVIPAAIYALWVLSHRYVHIDMFDFQIVPAMVGMFAYKAAALVQVYRDNEDLRVVFPENEEGSSE